MNPRALFVIASLLSTSACQAQGDAVEFAQLYRSPDAFEGNAISVVGILWIGREGDAICESKDKEDLLTCLELDWSNFERSEAVALDDKTIRIEGRFHPRILGFERGVFSHELEVSGLEEL
jgi:hypothetical protein